MSLKPEDKAWDLYKKEKGVNEIIKDSPLGIAMYRMSKFYFKEGFSYKLNEIRKEFIEKLDRLNEEIRGKDGKFDKNV